MSAVIIHADDINREHQLARRHANDAIKHAIRCGELLMQKKAELPHGSFTAWIMQNCKFKQATANNYMRAAQNPNALGNSIRHLFPSGRPGASAVRAAAKVAEPDYLKKAADMVGVPVEMARRAQVILQRDPVLAELIADGSITLNDAEKIISNKVAEAPNSPLPDVAGGVPIASPRASYAVEIPDEGENPTKGSEAQYERRNRELQASFESVVAAEVERRLTDAAREAIERAERKAKNAESLKDVYQARANSCRVAVSLFMDNWRTLAACLHPDRPDRSHEQLTKASDTLLRIKAAMDGVGHERW